jgi:hypothetical protein
MRGGNKGETRCLWSQLQMEIILLELSSCHWDADHRSRSTFDMGVEQQINALPARSLDMRLRNDVWSSRLSPKCVCIYVHWNDIVFDAL